MTATKQPLIKLKRATLFGIDTNAKTKKGVKFNYMTAILYLAPAQESKAINVCKYASEGCKAACLYTAGRGKMPSVYNARIQKTLEFAADPKGFVEQLALDIAKAVKKAKNKGAIPCIRLNGTSDLPFEIMGGHEKKNLMLRFPDVQFYDYTKDPSKAIKFAKGLMPSNYHVTFSKSECNLPDVKKVLKAGGNVAVVFSGKLPAKYLGFPVVSGDDSDLRFLDTQGVIVGLTAKGDAKGDTSGFVVKGDAS
tara:strand:+ start:8954 stop:9706 length:753 start_codon:yes stop_codon:yes gene_type:complete